MYDFDGLQAAQVALGLPARWLNPFPYPPTTLLLLRPLGLLPYEPALAAWIGCQIVFYLWSVLGTDGCDDNPAPTGWRARVAMAAALLLAPTATLNLEAGQGGLLAAGLLVGGMRRAAARPVLGGVLLGLLTYKPQLGLLVPLALAAAHWWRCAATACLTAAALAMASAAAFGWRIWPLWIASLPGYQDRFERSDHGGQLMVTVADNLRVLGVPACAGQAVQVAAGGLAAAGAWVCFRRGDRIPATAGLVAATCLANPHAFVYDLPMLDAAAVLLAAHRLHRGPGLLPGELLVLLAVVLFPSAMVVAGAPAGTAVLAVFLAMVVARQPAWRAT